LPCGVIEAQGGFRFDFFTIAPDTSTRLEQINTASALEEIQLKLPRMREVLEPDHPGVHTTDTVDFGVVFSGEVPLELDGAGSSQGWRLRDSEWNSPRLAQSVLADLLDS
jgi:hypothetical protein